MGRGAWLAVSGVSVLGAAGLGVWAWWLWDRPLAEQDQWASVGSSFATGAALLVAVVALIVGLRQPSGDAGSTSVHNEIGAVSDSGRATQIGSVDGDVDLRGHG